jgi:ferritin-like metal-binding protein YciE
METPQQVVLRYVQDCEAAERLFHHALETFAHTGEQNQVKHMFEMAATRAKTQHQRLEQRLRELGGEPSEGKSMLAHFLGFGPTVAQIGHEAAEKNTQHLMICIAAASAEMAMYEALATVSNAAGDARTETLARELQAEERDDYDKAWTNLRESAKAAFEVVVARHAGA